jgi:hypothetical protein
VACLLKLKPTVGLSDINAARNSVDEVYQSIIEDLTFASQNLSNNSSLKIELRKVLQMLYWREFICTKKITTMQLYTHQK